MGNVFIEIALLSLLGVFGIPLLLFIWGSNQRILYPKKAKSKFIIATVYLTLIFWIGFSYILANMNEYDAVILFIMMVMIGPPILLTTIGFLINPKHTIAKKTLFIIAIIYLIVGLGICATIFS